MNLIATIHGWHSKYNKLSYSALGSCFSSCTFFLSLYYCLSRYVSFAHQNFQIIRLHWASSFRNKKNTAKTTQQQHRKIIPNYLEFFPALVRSTIVSNILVLFAFIFIYFGCMVLLRSVQRVQYCTIRIYKCTCVQQQCSFFEKISALSNTKCAKKTTTANKNAKTKWMKQTME